jgi:VWFA-related protein
LPVIFLFPVIVSAQTPQPTATPFEDDGDVVKISTNLIQIDVVVTDKKGNQVTNLKPEDFEIFENGKKQNITNFSYISQETVLPQSDEKRKDKLAAPIPSVKLKPEQVRHTYALVVDDLRLDFVNTATVKYVLKKFVNEQMQKGDLVAIIRTGSGVGALQSFTSDKRQLFAAIAKIKWNFAIPEDTNFGLSSSSVFESADKFAQENNDIRNQYLVSGTLGALNYVVRGMRELPGRKAVMLFSSGFPRLGGNNGNAFVAEGNRRLRSLVELANRSAVVFHTLDPTGLINPAYFDASSSAPTQIISPSRSLRSSLSYLARETGGTAYVNQNDLNYGLKRAIKIQNGYYLIGYQPDSDAFDPKKNRYNKFTVKVKGEDLEVRYRSGFFGIEDKKIPQIKQTPLQDIYTALISPFGKNDISVNLNTLFGEDSENGRFIRSLIYVPAKDIVFAKTADNKREAKFDVLAMTFSDEGKSIEEFAKSYAVTVTEEKYQKILQTGFVYNIPVPIKDTGAYQFRIALRDSNTGKVGSASQFIEVPKLKKNRINLSSILLENLTLSEWRNSSLKDDSKTADNEKKTSMDFDMAVRRYKRNSILNYGYIIYNAVSPPADIKIQTRLFYNGKIYLEGQPTLLDVVGQNDLQRIRESGTIKLGDDLPLGDYILQVIVTDLKKKKVVSQWIDFEIVE